MLELGGEEFPLWEGDLLIGSLRAQALFRVGVRAGRVIYAERIHVGKHVRDLVEDQEGRVLIWTDESTLVSLTNAGVERTGEVVYSQCAVCHEGREGVPATAPDLRGLFGREAGRLPGYAFSQAFQDLELEWTSESLNRFLADPSGFVPGTTMRLEGISEADGEAVIEFMRTYN